MPVSSRQVIRVPVQPFFIGKAVLASFWKCGFMGDTFVRGRNAFEKFQRSLVGDMGKLSLKFWLESQGLNVIDWDDVRTSWRSARKQFDLEVEGHQVEVRSSVAGNTNVAEVIREEHIIQPYRVRAKEITVQVFFPDNTCHEAWLAGWAYGTDLAVERYKEIRRIGPRLVDFYMMGFGDANARPMSELVRTLAT